MPAFITNTVHIQRYADAVYGVQVGSVTLAQVNADITSLGGIDKALNAYYAGSGQTNATIAANIVKNVGIVVGGTITAAAVTDATAYVLGQLNANKGNEGATIKNILNLVGNLTADPIYGAAAVKFNADVDNAIAYTGASDVVAGSVIAASAPFTLTTAVETVPSSATVSGIIANGVANGQTFNSGDSITGATNLNVIVSVAAAAPVSATLTNVTNANFNMLAADTINAQLFTGVTNVGSAGGGNILTVTNGDLASTYRVAGETTGGGANNAIVGGVSVGLRASQLSGTADVAKFSVNTAGISTGTTLTGLTTNFARIEATTTGVETISIATAGTNAIQVFGSTTAATDAKTLTITGNGTNTINASSLTQVSLIDASASTGTNTISMLTNLQSAQTIKGGTGTDTVSTSLSGTAAGLTFTGVETLSLSGAAAQTLSFATLPGITTVRSEHQAASTGTTDSLVNVDFANLTFRGAGTTATSATTQSFNALTSSASFAGTSDALAMGFNNRGTALTTGTGYETGLLTLSGVESATISVADVSSTGATTIGGITADRMTSLTAASAGHVVLGTITAAGALGTGSLTNLNLSGVTGTSTSTLAIDDNTTTAATTITASVNGVNITGFGANQTTDSVIFTGAEGGDTVTGTSFTGRMIIDGKGGADTLLGGTGADTITGGEGADTITGNGGNDTIILAETVAVADKFVFSGSTTLALQLTANGVDTITGFTSVDTINVAALGDGTTGAGLTAITAAAAQGALTDDRAIVISTTGAAANLTTGGTAVVTDWTNMTQVAAYLTERFTSTIAGTQKNVIVINNTSGNNDTSYVYSLIDAGTQGTVAAEIQLMGTISHTPGTALTASNVVYA